MAHFTGNPSIDLCCKSVEWFHFGWVCWRRVLWRLISLNVLSEVLTIWLLPLFDVNGWLNWKPGS